VGAYSTHGKVRCIRMHARETWRGPDYSDQAMIVKLWTEFMWLEVRYIDVLLVLSFHKTWIFT
jgi:hypothetical protein